MSISTGHKRCTFLVTPENTIVWGPKSTLFDRLFNLSKWAILSSRLALHFAIEYARVSFSLIEDPGRGRRVERSAGLLRPLFFYSSVFRLRL